MRLVLYLGSGRCVEVLLSSAGDTFISQFLLFISVDYFLLVALVSCCEKKSAFNVLITCFDMFQIK